jgi:hypothetical protein
MRLYADGFSASMSTPGYSKELGQIRRDRVVVPVGLRSAFLYNPGLEYTWFTFTGITFGAP